MRIRYAVHNNTKKVNTRLNSKRNLFSFHRFYQLALKPSKLHMAGTCGTRHDI